MGLSRSILVLFVEFLVDQSLAVSALLVYVIVEPLPIPFLVVHPTMHSGHSFAVPLMLVHHGALSAGFLFHQLPLQVIPDIVVVLLSLVL